jgi:CheY-like chemotaxis protein
MSPRILLVDDNPELRSDIRWKIETGIPGCTVVDVQNEDGARREFERSQFDAVVADIKLDEAGGGEFGGLEVLHLASRGRPPVPVIVVTAAVEILRPLLETDARGGTTLRDYVLQLGAAEFVDRRRPGVNYLDEILRHVRAILERRSPPGEA